MQSLETDLTASQCDNRSWLSQSSLLLSLGE
jgi:hypothetical protein